MKLVLASASPRRREILKNAGYLFSVRPAQIEERLDPALLPGQAVAELAAQKAACAARHAAEEELILAADTIVVRDSAILGKPKDEAQAFAMLRSLAGREHTVYTGVCVALPGENGKKEAFSCATAVRFYSLSDDEIRSYIATGEPMDKAGAYGIQGKCAIYIDKISGDYNNVVGLPVAAIYRELKKLGIDLYLW